MFQNLNVVKVVEHQCPSEPAKNDVDLAMANLNENIIKPDEPIPKIFNEAVGNLLDGGLHLVTHVPEFEKFQHGLIWCTK